MRWVALLEKIGTGQQTIFARLWLLLSVGFLTYSPAYGLVISEIMYNPPGDDTDYEWLELYNETAAYQDLSCCQFTDGIEFTFPSGASLAPYGHLVVARNPNAVMTRYGISNVVGPYKGALDNGGEQVILRDPSGGIIAEVDYKDDGRWPVAPDGAGHSLSKLNLRGAPNDADNWRASPSLGGTPGVANQFEPWIEENKIIGSGEVWRYFKGYSEASNPIDAWRQVDFDDSGWLSGPTGIGYGDGDDATALDDMWWRYLSIFCRRTFYLGDPSWIDRLILTIDYDDGFV
ncbi:lamin tail domain-containing protein, partial [Candidatus Sumerlaeota bacterium]|nr:lamin tail domain-containing protein [Candidatus Sumerlaeota bacterium]